MDSKFVHPFACNSVHYLELPRKERPINGDDDMSTDDWRSPKG